MKFGDSVLTDDKFFGKILEIRVDKRVVVSHRMFRNGKKIYRASQLTVLTDIEALLLRKVQDLESAIDSMRPDY